MTRDILCVHLLDDFSGSAKVFATAIEVLRKAGFGIRVVVGSQGRDGFIRRRHSVELIPYRFHRNKLLLLFYFSLAQIWLFFKVCWILLSGQVGSVYVNTLLPVGAILAGAVCRRPVVTHIHEVGMGSQALFRVLLWVAVRFSSRLITVSNYVVVKLDLPVERTAVIYNALDSEEWSRASSIATRNATETPKDKFRVMMACSLKWYKGVEAFMDLVRACRASADRSVRDAAFLLVLNCEAPELSEFRSGLEPDDAVEIVRRPASVYDQYSQASLVLNLSLPEGWIETFGLTLLEAMSCGIPVISPEVGGCTELFEQGQGGWHIDARKTEEIVTHIAELASDSAAWHLASAHARQAADNFSPSIFARQVVNLFSYP